MGSLGSYAHPLIWPQLATSTLPGALMVNELEAALLAVGLAAESSYCPAVLSASPLNVTTPLTAVAVSVPLRFPGPLATERVTVESSLATSTPAFSNSTVIAGERAKPASVPIGCWAKTSWAR